MPDRHSPQTGKARSPNDLLQRYWPFVLCGVGLIALGIRAWVGVAIWNLPASYLLNADSFHYHREALVLAGQQPGELPPVFGLSPLTVLWGALLHVLFGPSIWAVIAPQLLLGAGTAMLAAVIGCRLAGPVAGVIAGLLTATSGPLIAYDTAILATSPAVFLGTLTAWLCLWAAGKPSVVRAALVGLSSGLWVICRPNMALFFPLALALLLFRSQAWPARRRWLLAGALTLAFLLPIAPITAANGVRGKVFVPVTWSMGINLFIGNNQGATGRLKPTFGDRNAHESFAVFAQQAMAATGKPLDPAQVSRFWTAQTGREIADDPVRFAGLLGRKLVYALNRLETPDTWSLPFLELVVGPLGLPWIGFELLLPLGLVGLVLIWRRNLPGSRALPGIALVCLATMLIFFVTARFRAPMLPVLAVGSGMSAVWFVRQLRQLLARGEKRERRRQAIAVAAGALAVCLSATVANLPLLHAELAPEVIRLSRSYQLEGRHKEAEATMKQIALHAREIGDLDLARATLTALGTLGNPESEANQQKTDKE